jgi:SAM-dependent methyltransferase
VRLDDPEVVRREYSRPERLAARIAAHALTEGLNARDLVGLSPQMAELARRRGVDARVGDVQGLPVAGGEFDCVLAAWMLYHVPDLDRALSDAAVRAYVSASITRAHLAGRLPRLGGPLRATTDVAVFTAET